MEVKQFRQGVEGPVRSDFVDYFDFRQSGILSCLVFARAHAHARTCMYVCAWGGQVVIEQRTVENFHTHKVTDENFRAQKIGALELGSTAAGFKVFFILILISKNRGLRAALDRSRLQNTEGGQLCN